MLRFCSQRLLRGSQRAVLWLWCVHIILVLVKVFWPWSRAPSASGKVVIKELKSLFWFNLATLCPSLGPPLGASRALARGLCDQCGSFVMRPRWSHRAGTSGRCCLGGAAVVFVFAKLPLENGPNGVLFVMRAPPSAQLPSETTLSSRSKPGLLL